MNEVAYENIDLFYYHSIDFDFSRLFSILNNGIVSEKAAREENVQYYYRNYTNSSCRNDYVSVSHFPNTVFRYYNLENELFDFNTNKIVFILNGEIDTLEKQYCRNRYHYTNERHVNYKINVKDIKGILLRECDLYKAISDVAFNYKYTDISYLEQKVFTTIEFYKNHFQNFFDEAKIYYLLGKFRYEQFLGNSGSEIVREIQLEILKGIKKSVGQVLKVDNPTVLDVTKYINNGRYLIYAMNRFDIQEIGMKLRKIDSRTERFEEEYGEMALKAKSKGKIDKKVNNLLNKMTYSGSDIYFGYTQGPLVEDDDRLVKKILKMKV